MKVQLLSIFRKRLSFSESSFTESDSSPPSGARRRFSALMDTHRLDSPLEVDSELHVPTKQPPVKARGASLEGAMGAIPSQADLRPFLKDPSGNMWGGSWTLLVTLTSVIRRINFSLYMLPSLTKTWHPKYHQSYPVRNIAKLRCLPSPTDTKQIIQGFIFIPPYSLYICHITTAHKRLQLVQNATAMLLIRSSCHSYTITPILAYLMAKFTPKLHFWASYYILHSSTSPLFQSWPSIPPLL